MQEGKIVFKCEDKYFVTKRGWVITGRVFEGVISIGTEIGLVDNEGKIIQVGSVIFIEKERKLVDEVTISLFKDKKVKTCKSGKSNFLFV